MRKSSRYIFAALICALMIQFPAISGGVAEPLPYEGLQSDLTDDPLFMQFRELTDLYIYIEDNFLYDIDYEKSYISMQDSLISLFDEDEQESVREEVDRIIDVDLDVRDAVAESMGCLYGTAKYLSESYPEKFEDVVVADEIAAALLASLDDRYSQFVPSDEAAEYEAQSMGTYSGIGIYLTKMNPDMADMDNPREYMVSIVSPFPGGPMDLAGVRAGDYISHIDGEDVSHMTAKEASSKMKGEPGTAVHLTIWRNGYTFDIDVKRQMVSSPSETHDVIDGDIGYIAISEFSMSTASQVSEAVDDVLENGAESLIIDLRNNGGGIVDSALRIANLFLDDELILIREDKNVRMPVKRYVASRIMKVDKDFPIVLLVNGGTASSSEILTGALKDNGRATVIGEKTYGKGIIQSVIPFNGGYAEFTTGQYKTPDGTDIHGKGIEPDMISQSYRIEGDEIDEFERLIEDGIASDYVDEHPEYSDENVRNFIGLASDYELPEYALITIIRNEYISRMDYDDRPVADTRYDENLRDAIRFLRGETV